MNLLSEAYYMYYYSRELIKINKKVKRHSKKAEKYVHKHRKAKTEEKKSRHKLGHQKATGKIKDLIEQHNRILKKLRHHHNNYLHALKKEHSIKKS